MMVIISTIVLLALNLIAKLLLSHYAWFNFMISSLVLCNNALLVSALTNPKIADGFRIGMSFVYSFIGTVMFVLSQFCPQAWQENWMLLAIIIVSGFEWLGMMLFRVVSKVSG
jgi:hypothetical protein